MKSNTKSSSPPNSPADSTIIPIDQDAGLLAQFSPEVLALFQELEAKILSADELAGLVPLTSSSPPEAHRKSQGAPVPETSQGLPGGRSERGHL